MVLPFYIQLLLGSTKTLAKFSRASYSPSNGCVVSLVGHFSGALCGAMYWRLCWNYTQFHLRKWCLVGGWVGYQQPKFPRQFAGWGNLWGKKMIWKDMTNDMITWSQGCFRQKLLVRFPKALSFFRIFADVNRRCVGRPRPYEWRLGSLTYFPDGTQQWRDPLGLPKVGGLKNRT